MIKIDENKWKRGLKNVLAQTEKYNNKHFVFVSDPEFHDGRTYESKYTSDGIDFSQSVIDIELELDGCTTSFRMAQSGN